MQELDRRKMPSGTNDAKSKSKKQPGKTKPTQTGTCGKCDSNFRPTDKIVQCSTCHTDFHKTCQNVSDSLYEFLNDETENDSILWFCNICRKVTSGILSKLSNIEIRLKQLE